MKYGHKLNLTIADYDEKGRGRGEIEIVPGEWRPIVVPFTAQGDKIEATFVKREYGLKICRLDSVVEAGTDRIKAPCPYAGTCGGCLWQHLDYTAQLKEKERGIRELFVGLGLEAALKPIIPAEQTLGYRNRMDFCIGWNGEVGLKEYGSWNRYVNVGECLLMKPDVKDILQAIRDWMKEFDLQPWDAKFHTGDVRYTVIRDGKNTHQRLIIVVVHDGARITDQARTWLTDKLTSQCTSLLLGELKSPTDLSLAERFETLIGAPWLEEKVNDNVYRIHPNSFFQTNTAMAAKLQDTVLASVRRTRDVGRGTLLDLYCGLGFFGIAAAKRDDGLQVHGHELDEEAIKLASQNAEMNKVGERCRFTAGKAEDLSWKDVDAQAVILDPPRSGLHPRVIQALLEDPPPAGGGVGGGGRLRPSTLVYVSCNYHRLKDELPLLMKKFAVESIQPLDLFPQTPHVEVVVTMRRSPSP